MLLLLLVVVAPDPSINISSFVPVLGFNLIPVSVLSLPMPSKSYSVLSEAIVIFVEVPDIVVFEPCSIFNLVVALDASVKITLAPAITVGPLLAGTFSPLTI